MNKRITITKVVSKHVFGDILTRVQNFFGMNLTPYEKMIQEGIRQVEREIKENKIRLKWYRYETTQLTNGAIAMMLYGERK